MRTGASPEKMDPVGAATLGNLSQVLLADRQRIKLRRAGRCRAAAAPNLRHPNDPAAEDGAAQPFLLPAVLMPAVGMAGAVAGSGCAHQRQTALRQRRITTLAYDPLGYAAVGKSSACWWRQSTTDAGRACGNPQTVGIGSIASPFSLRPMPTRAACSGGTTPAGALSCRPRLATVGLTATPQHKRNGVPP